MNATSIDVTVAYSPCAGRVDLVSLSLPEGSTLADALAASGHYERHPQARGLPVGIWGRQEEAGAVLRMHDRVEIYRPLQCDPKEARRVRYRQKSERMKGRPGPGVSGNPTR